MKIIVLVLLSAFVLYSQSDWKRWGKADFHYSKYHTDDSHTNEEINFGETIINSAVFIYRVTFSDLDGDNCPFTPTCSSFLKSSVKETNVIQGTVMFFDRFMRDMNLFERHKHYPVIKNERYFDPPSLYTLNDDKTKTAVRILYNYNK